LYDEIRVRELTAWPHADVAARRTA
jgi:hypothetical protein